MSPFVATNKTPGVYIDEVQLPGAIAGVSTSTAGFLGPARRGPLNKPVLLTNWTEFINTFGPQDPQDPLGPYILAPQVYVTHAVRGFFDNGGAMCYFVRVGTGVQASLKLMDRGTTAQAVLAVSAKQEGTAGNSITVAVQDASIVSAATAVQFAAIPLTSASGTTATAANATDAAKFRPGDAAFLQQGGTSERAWVSRVSGATITFTSALLNAYNNTATMRMADLNPGQTRVRLADVTGIEPGSYVKISQTVGANTTWEGQVVQSVERANNAITLASGLSKLYVMDNANGVTLSTLEVTLQITTPGIEQYPNLSMDPRHSRYFANIVNSPTVNVDLADPPSTTPGPANLPVVLAATALQGGVADNIAGIQPTNYHTAIDSLKRINDVNILCAPDAAAFTQTADTQDVQAYLIAHCEKMQDRFAVLDARAKSEPADVTTQRSLLNSDAGYSALYYPWIVIGNPVGNGRVTVPPSGHVAGVYAQVDNARGVHKAPANESIRGVLALERILTDDEHGPLNEKGINVIRLMAGSGIRIWGARTIAPHDRIQWRYVNVRRLLIFIEQSIQQGTQFAVFEPNDLSLWGKLKRQVTDFLTRVWQDGALFGATADQAFRVRVDEELNPPSVRQLGQLVIEVVLYPTTPAEFVVFRIIQQPGGPVVQE